MKLSQHNGDEATTLFQCLIDETLWLHEKEAWSHAFSHYRDRYYRSERVTKDPPKGVYSAVGVCGMSQTLLGPPNHHEYQDKIKRLHAERFSHLPLEVFKSRIQMSREEALLERWKEEQSTQEVFYFLTSTAEETEINIGSLIEAEEHFQKTLASSVVKKVEEKIMLHSPTAWQQSCSAVRQAVEQEIESLKHFPLSFSQEIGQELAARGLQLFKKLSSSAPTAGNLGASSTTAPGHKNIVCVSVARPRSFYQQEQSVSNSVKRVLEILKEHAAAPRAEQWKALLSSRSPEQPPEEHEATLLKDLSWLLHEGYVVNYASQGFEVA